MSERKHYGKLKSTDSRCIVVMPYLPEMETHCLILNTERLNTYQEQLIHESVDSYEGQNAPVLAEFLSRRKVESSNLDALTTFHNEGLLSREPVDNIILLPRPNQPVELKEVVAFMLKMKAEAENAKKAENEAVTKLHNQVAENVKASQHESNLRIAHNLLIDAGMLEEQAIRKREEAYTLAPELRPAPKPIVSESPAEEARKVFSVEIPEEMTSEQVLDVVDSIKKDVSSETETAEENPKTRKKASK